MLLWKLITINKLRGNLAYQELCTANGATIRYESSALLDEDIRQRYGAGFVITPQQRQVAEVSPAAAPSRMER